MRMAVPPKTMLHNADGLAMPDIEHWASNRKAMAGSDQTDVSGLLQTVCI